MWHQIFVAFALKLGYVRSEECHSIYIKIIDQKLIILLYVDDMFIGNTKAMLRELKTQLSSTFDIKDLGVDRYILGMEISKNRIHTKLWLRQSEYADTILQRFKMRDYKLVSIPFPIATELSLDMCPYSDDDIEEMFNVFYASVGSLMYAMVCTRPNIVQAVGVLSRFMSNPSKEHLTFVKRVLRYLQGTFDYCLDYHGTNHVESDWTYRILLM